jgi:GNAT superfamily N-acetyltransferase
MSDISTPTIVTNDEQAREVARFMQACCGGHWQPWMYHIGDLWWYRALNPAGAIGVWRDAQGSITGFAWLEQPDSVVLQIRPDLRGQGALESAMVDWAIRNQSQPMLWTRAFESDTATRAWLEAHGFERDPRTMILHRRDMADAIPDDETLPNFEVRHVQAHERQERVAAHRDAFEPSKFSLEKYELARNAPGYDPELDIVAVNGNGTIAAYCIAWYDEANRIGYFEPVGTRKAFQGRGLGRRVLHEALRRLRQQGAREAIVATNADNPPARALYHAVGFRDAEEEYLYGRKLHPSEAA